MCSGTAPVKPALCGGVRTRTPAAESHRGWLFFSTATRAAFALQGRSNNSSTGFEFGAQAAARAHLRCTMSAPYQVRHWMTARNQSTVAGQAGKTRTSAGRSFPHRRRSTRRSRRRLSAASCGSLAPRRSPPRAPAQSPCASLGNPLISINDRRAPPQRTPGWHNTAWAGPPRSLLRCAPLLVGLAHIRASCDQKRRHRRAPVGALARRGHVQRRVPAVTAREKAARACAWPRPLSAHQPLRTEQARPSLSTVYSRGTLGVLSGYYRGT
jgi:hypothetical protein